MADSGHLNLPPAIAEAGVIFDGVELRVDIAEFAPDALDKGPHVDPIPLRPNAGGKAGAADNVIKTAVPQIPARLLGQERDNGVFAQGQGDFAAFPTSPVPFGIQMQGPKTQDFVVHAYFLQATGAFACRAATPCIIRCVLADRNW